MQYYTKKTVKGFQKDPFNLYALSQEQAHTQLADILYKEQANNKIDTLLDVAIGVGNSFKVSKRMFDVTTFIGNDYSPHMLKHAQSVVPNFRAICGDATQIHKKLPSESVDVAYAHYLLSYVNSTNLLQSINATLKPGGYLSLCTATWENLRSLQEIAETIIPSRFQREEKMNKYKDGLPKDTNAVIELLDATGFDVIKQEHICKDITFNRFNDFWGFAVDAGWLIQEMGLTGSARLDKHISHAVIKAIQIYKKALRPPVITQTKLCVVTAQKRRGTH